LHKVIGPRLQNISSSANSNIDSITHAIDNINTSIAMKSVTLSNADRKIIEYSKQCVELREKWNKTNSEVFKLEDSHEFKCPTCKQLLPAEQKVQKTAELEINFNTNKTRNLNQISAEGKTAKQNLEIYQSQKATLEAEIADLKVKLDEKNQDLKGLSMTANEPTQSIEDQLSFALNNDPSYQTTLSELEKLNESFAAMEADDQDATSPYQQRKGELWLRINELRTILLQKEQIERINIRIEELERQEREFGNQISELEGKEFLLAEYTKASVDILEQRINGKFSLVKFKMFEKQVNGGESPCCETTIDGVPFSDANTASRINAGLDIINTLCDHYDIYAPVFIDNAESVNTLVPVNSQLVRLVVSHDRQLRIEAGAKRGQLQLIA
jgi:exonuclease SbcC